MNVKEYIFFDIFAEILGKYRVSVWFKNISISKCQTLLKMITLFDIFSGFLLHIRLLIMSNIISYLF